LRVGGGSTGRTRRLAISGPRALSSDAKQYPIGSTREALSALSDGSTVARNADWQEKKKAREGKEPSFLTFGSVWAEIELWRLGVDKGG